MDILKISFLSFFCPCKVPEHVTGERNVTFGSINQKEIRYCLEHAAV